MGLGDVVCQKFIESKHVDGRRAFNAGLVGATWSGFASPQIYNWAERIVGPGKDLWSVSSKMVITTLILSTAGNYINMSGRRLLGGGYKDPAAVFRDINERFREVSNASATTNDDTDAQKWFTELLLVVILIRLLLRIGKCGLSTMRCASRSSHITFEGPPPSP